MPMFTYARTKQIAWGATAVNPDVTDLFVENIKGDTYFYDGKWLPIEKETEVIKVRFGSDIIMENRYTMNGIVMGKPEEDKMDFALWFPLEFLN